MNPTTTRDADRIDVGNCPTCSHFPTQFIVNPRGGDWGWGTTDEQRTTYRAITAPVTPAAEAAVEDSVCHAHGKSGVERLTRFACGCSTHEYVTGSNALATPSPAVSPLAESSVALAYAVGAITEREALRRATPAVSEGERAGEVSEAMVERAALRREVVPVLDAMRAASPQCADFADRIACAITLSTIALTAAIHGEVK